MLTEEYNELWMSYDRWIAFQASKFAFSRSERRRRRRLPNGSPWLVWWVRFSAKPICNSDRSFIFLCCPAAAAAWHYKKDFFSTRPGMWKCEHVNTFSHSFTLLKPGWCQPVGWWTVPRGYWWFWFWIGIQARHQPSQKHFFVPANGMTPFCADGAAAAPCCPPVGHWDFISGKTGSRLDGVCGVGTERRETFVSWRNFQ